MLVAATDAPEIDPDCLTTFLRAARNFGAVIAESLAQAEEVTLPQLRILVLASERGSLNNGAVAAALDVHLSNATRLCDRLVAAGLVNRREAKNDRRHVELTLTARGAQLVADVMDHRRASLESILQGIPADTRGALASALDVFSSAAEAQHATPPFEF